MLVLKGPIQPMALSSVNSAASMTYHSVTALSLFVSAVNVWHAYLQVLWGPAAHQHSLELQNCAHHLDKQITQLAQQHGLMADSSPSPTQKTDEPEAAASASGRTSASPASASAGDAAAARKAHAKARQVLVVSRFEHCQNNTECHADLWSELRLSVC